MEQLPVHLIPLVHHVLSLPEVKECVDVGEGLERTMAYLASLSTNYSQADRTQLMNVLSTVAAEYHDHSNWVENVVADVTKSVESILGELGASEETLLNSQIQLVAEAKTGKSASYSCFNFDDMAPFVSLDEVLECIKSNNFSMQSLQRLLEFDQYDLLEHPLWMNTLDVMQELLALISRPDCPLELVSMACALCERFLKAFKEHFQSGGVLEIVLQYLLDRLYNAEALADLPYSEINSDLIDSKDKLIISLTVVSLQTIQCSVSCYSNDVANKVCCCAILLLSRGQCVIGGQPIPLVAILASNADYLRTVVEFIVQCDPCLLEKQSSACRMQRDIETYAALACAAYPQHRLTMGLVCIACSIDCQLQSSSAHLSVSCPLRWREYQWKEVPGTNKKYSMFSALSQEEHSSSDHRVSLLALLHKVGEAFRVPGVECTADDKAFLVQLLMVVNSHESLRNLASDCFQILQSVVPPTDSLPQTSIQSSSQLLLCRLAASLKSSDETMLCASIEDCIERVCRPNQLSLLDASLLRLLYLRAPVHWLLESKESTRKLLLKMWNRVQIDPHVFEAEYESFQQSGSHNHMQLLFGLLHTWSLVVPKSLRINVELGEPFAMRLSVAWDNIDLACAAVQLSYQKAHRDAADAFSRDWETFKSKIADCINSRVEMLSLEWGDRAANVGLSGFVLLGFFQLHGLIPFHNPEHIVHLMSEPTETLSTVIVDTIAAVVEIGETECLFGMENVLRYLFKQNYNVDGVAL